MDELTVALLCVILVVLVVLVWLIWKSRSQDQKASVDPAAVQQAVQQAMMASTPMLKDAVTSSIAQGTDLFKGAFTASLQDLRFQEEMGIVMAAAADIKSTSGDLKALLAHKGARASFAEFQLEELLKDAFPEGKFGIRQSLGGLGTPDAHLTTSEGLICIDAKFPLENYKRIVEATVEGDRKRAASAFRQDVEKHIDKVAEYVVPGKTAPIAYMFIPSEAVYHYLADNEPELLGEATTHSVVVSSPSTLLANLSLIRISMRAQEITERATQIEADLRGLEQLFASFQGEWTVLKNHIQRAKAKSEDVDSSYGELKGKFEQVAKLKLAEPRLTEEKESG